MAQSKTSVIVLSLLIQTLKKDEEMIEVLGNIEAILKHSGMDTEILEIKELIESLKKDTVVRNTRLSPFGVK